MNIKRDISSDGKQAILHVKGEFNFALVQEVRNAYVDLKGKDVIVDLREATYMDSAGLGILLNMQDYLDKPNGAIKLVNCSDAIKRVLLIAKFEKKFHIE
ncbi:STAS domain-containing protein [Salinivibrio sp. ML290]|uniref:STAS domain-containing protein n=1 Tax=Salinivibrio sp. ML290 TaxID=1909468 RepID=UPI0009886F92|nr:STAS domain-containing protein [Salinivibrio sp. ML290]OOE76438.1 anti-anti-sigma factor [Salinivibrio sp. ML290]